MDELTSAVRKIKLHVPSREEHEARERKRIEDLEKATVKKALKPTKSFAAPRAKRTTPPAKPAPSAEPIPAVALPVQDLPMPDYDPIEPKSISTGISPEQPMVNYDSLSPTEAESLRTRSSVSPPQTLASLSSNGDAEAKQTEFIHFPNPNGQQPHQAIKPDSLVWLPPNTSTPPPQQRKNTLPTFTSTSPIPFAQGKMQQRMGGFPAPPPATAESQMQSEAKQNGYGSNHANGARLHANGEADSIWDVPVTPEPKAK